MERHERFETWLRATYKTDATLVVAANGRLGEKSVRMWRRGEGEPSVEKLAVLCTLGLDASWYLAGVGEMFSQTAKGREFAKDAWTGPATSARKRSIDRAPELIEDIEEVLQKYRG